jgi:hypothetical protein
VSRPELRAAILHVDMDAFYASVEERDRPELKGKPLIVGGTAAAASSPPPATRCAASACAPPCPCAKRCALPGGDLRARRAWRATRRSPQVFAIFHEFTPLVEGLSLDEAFLDVTASQQLFGEPEKIGAEIRRRIARHRTHRIGRNRTEQAAGKDRLGPQQARRHVPHRPDNMHDVLDPCHQKLFGVGPRRCRPCTPRASDLRRRAGRR